MNPHCSIIALNWNGVSDTIEFIASLFSQDYENYSLILVDNHSTDDSIEEIKRWAQNPILPKTKYQFNSSNFQPFSIFEIDATELEKVNLTKQHTQNGIILIRNEENLGFAKAVNQGIKFAEKTFASEYYFLLNNDIFIERKAIVNILNAAENLKEYDIFQSAIFYYDHPQNIWNAGGIILPWGQTKYFKTLKKGEITRRTYSLSGCALLLKRKTIHELGLLDERFFHGEEDLDYAIRAKKMNKKSAVVQNSIIYHKVSAAANIIWVRRVDRFVNLALNRFLNMKSYFPQFVWKIWRLGTILYYFILLQIIYKQSIKRSVRILLKIYKYSNFIDKVDPEILKKIQKELQ